MIGSIIDLQRRRVNQAESRSCADPRYPGRRLRRGCMDDHHTTWEEGLQQDGERPHLNYEHQFDSQLRPYGGVRKERHQFQLNTMRHEAAPMHPSKFTS